VETRHDAASFGRNNHKTGYSAMTDTTLSTPGLRSTLRHLWQDQRVWLASAVILAALAVFDPPQAVDSAVFAGGALLHTAPYLVLSIAIAAWAGATGADNLIAKAFTGAPILMIGLGALAGGLSPFCSCGVIPLIAALLAMGVPLSAVMAFWLASPLMDPSMFVLTSGVLDLEFAIAKTAAARWPILCARVSATAVAAGQKSAHPSRSSGASGKRRSAAPSSRRPHGARRCSSPSG
jgi:hypothetical protein